MARIRSIHPGLFRDESFMSLSLAAKAAWPGIWTESDDHGVFEWKPVTLKATLLPADNVDMIALLDEYVALGMIVKFTERGKAYGAIKGFMKWQRPRQPSYRFPFPKEAELFVRNCGSPDEVADAEGAEMRQDAPVEEGALRQPSGSDPPLKGDPLPQDYGSPATVPPTMAAQMEEGGGRRKDSEEDKSSSADRFAPSAPDPKAVLFGPAVRAFVASATGKPPDAVGKQIGRWCKDFGRDHAGLLAVLAAAQDDPPGDLIQWIGGAIRRRKAESPPPPRSVAEAMEQFRNDPNWAGVEI